MRQIVIAAHVLVVAVACCSLSPHAWAQNCKPDASETDKLTKEKYDLYAQVLSSKGGLMSTSNTSIMALAWRQANVNYIQLRVQKSEQSAVNAAFESATRGAIGKPFYFGFKTGDPVAFEVTSVDSVAGVAQGLFAATGVTATIFRAAVSDKALAALREVLVSRQIDAVRIELAGDGRIEVSVDDRSGRKMMEKFSCFYRSLDKRGIDLSAAVDRPAKAGQPASGAGAAGNPLAAAPEAAPGAVTPPTAAGTPTDEIFKMIAAKLPEETILLQVRKAGGTVNLSTDDLIRLKQAGATDQFVRSLLQGDGVQPAVAPRSAPKGPSAPDSKGEGLGESRAQANRFSPSAKQSGEVSINVNGTWTSKEWGRVILNQKGESLDVVGTGDGWDLQGVVSGNKVSLAFSSKGRVAYSAELTADGPNSLDGGYVNGSLYEGMKTKPMHLTKVEIGGDQPKKHRIPLIHKKDK